MAHGTCDVTGCAGLSVERVGLRLQRSRAEVEFCADHAPDERRLTAFAAGVERRGGVLSVGAVA